MSIKSVDFYGEHVDWPVSDLIHCEPLEHRSEAHGWEIHAHQHAKLCQIFLLTDGTGKAEIDGVTYSLNANSLLFIPNHRIHSFQWQSDVKGTVLTIALPLIKRFKEVYQFERDPLNQVFYAPIDQTKAQLCKAISAHIHQQLRDTNTSENVRIDSLQHSLLFSLLGVIVQSSPPTNEAKADEARCDRYLQLIERHALQEHRVEWYAKQLHINPIYLNALCNNHLGQTAQSLIHQRLVLEAKRLLIYTVRSNTSIAFEIGFKDPSYFNRFFKRLTGMTPKQFRKSFSH